MGICVYTKNKVHVEEVVKEEGKEKICSPKKEKKDLKRCVTFVSKDYRDKKKNVNLKNGENSNKILFSDNDCLEKYQLNIVNKSPSRLRSGKSIVF